MASACLPLLFRAVEIDGVPYWDGGYMGNPAIFPFFAATESEDVLVVQINPVERRDTPHLGARDHEPGQRDHVQLLAARRIARDRVRRPPDRPGKAAARDRTGQVPARQRASDRPRRLRQERSSADTKLNNDYDFFDMLRQNGRRAARRFLDAHFADIGVRSTIDLRAEVRAEQA